MKQYKGPLAVAVPSPNSYGETREEVIRDLLVAIAAAEGSEPPENRVLLLDMPAFGIILAIDSLYVLLAKELE